MRFVTKQAAVSMLGRAGLDGVARLIVQRLSPAHKKAREVDMSDIAGLGSGLQAIRQNLAAASERNKRNTLIIGMGNTRYIAQQMPLIAGIVAAGFRPVVLLPSRFSRHEQALYREFGIEHFAHWDQRIGTVDPIGVLADFEQCQTQQAVLGLKWRNIAIGKFAISTLMRRTRTGHLDLSEPSVRAMVRDELIRTQGHAASAIAILDEFNPALAAFVDRGYSPEGPLFEACLQRKIEPITFNVAHKDNTYMLKRYKQDEGDVHPSSLSAETWAVVRNSPWSEANWQRLRKELIACYSSGQWYGEVGTQFGAKIDAPRDLQMRLALDLSKNTALIFPHIFWDATFFWGEDVFADYEDWFRQTVECAIANPEMNWIIKIHPANAIKNKRDGVDSEFSEIRVLKEFGSLPGHIRVLGADTDIATLSLYSVADVCLTVRGTVGIEAAAFGLNVITAGTGRYDRLGFTIDAGTKDEYRNLLANLQGLSAPTQDRIDLARRYATAVFLSRPLELEMIRFHFAQEETAKLNVELNAASSGDVLASRDVQAMGNWLRSGAKDFLSVSDLGH